MRKSTIPEKFSDFSLAFIPNPNTGDITKLSNENAIKRSLRNIMLTAYGERLFYPEKGCGLYKILFEMISPPAAFSLEEYITTAIKNQEPRVKLHGVTAVPNYDLQGYDIEVQYEIVNQSGLISVQYFLERVK